MTLCVRGLAQKNKALIMMACIAVCGNIIPAI